MQTKNIELHYQHRPVATILLLKAIDTTNIVDGEFIVVTAAGIYQFNKTSVATPDDFNIVQPNTGGGLWYLTTGYMNPLPTTTTTGGIPAGSTFFNTVKSFPETIAATYYAYLNPAFTSFALSGITTLEVGSKITGSHNFTWAISNSGNVQANSINISDITNALTLITGHSITSPAAYDFTAYPSGGLEYDITTTNTFQIQGTNTHSITFTRNVIIAWEWLVHSGSNVNDTLTNSQVLALADSSLTTVFPPSVSFTGSGYFWYWIPTTFLQPTIFKDAATGFAIAMESPVTQTITNAFGIDQSYKGYRSTESLVAALTIDVQ